MEHLRRSILTQKFQLKSNCWTSSKENKMRKILMTISALTLMSGLCFAQSSPATSKPAITKAPEMKAPEALKAPAAVAGDKGKPATMGAVMDAAKAFHGKIESVSVADAAKGTKSEIVAVDDSGKKMDFWVKPTTTIYDAALQPITLDKIKADDKAMVKYEVNKEGLNETQSISLMK